MLRTLDVLHKLTLTVEKLMNRVDLVIWDVERLKKRKK